MGAFTAIGNSLLSLLKYEQVDRERWKLILEKLDKVTENVERVPNSATYPLCYLR